MAKSDERWQCRVRMAAFYVSDLDGTLLRRDATLSPASRDALRALLADGVHFSVASARSVASMRPLLEGLRFSLPVIEFNGAFVSDLETGRHEIVNAIDAPVARAVYETIARFTPSLFVSTFDGAADRVYHGEPTNDGERFYVENRRRFNDARLRHAPDLAAALADQIVCLTVIGEPGPLATLELAIAERFAGLVEIHLFENAYSPGWYWLTVHDRRATKDQAIRTIVETRGLASHELIVFGDHLNDVKMFGIAKHAIAVANAHPDVKQRATLVIGSNDEDSVAEYIRLHHSRGSSQTISIDSP